MGSFKGILSSPNLDKFQNRQQTKFCIWRYRSIWTRNPIKHPVKLSRPPGCPGWRTDVGSNDGPQFRRSRGILGIDWDQWVPEEPIPCGQNRKRWQKNQGIFGHSSKTIYNGYWLFWWTYPFYSHNDKFEQISKAFIRHVGAYFRCTDSKDYKGRPIFRIREEKTKYSEAIYNPKYGLPNHNFY